MSIVSWSVCPFNISKYCSAHQCIDSFNLINSECQCLKKMHSKINVSTLEWRYMDFKPKIQTERLHICHTLIPYKWWNYFWKKCVAYKKGEVFFLEALKNFSQLCHICARSGTSFCAAQLIPRTNESVFISSANSKDKPVSRAKLESSCSRAIEWELLAPDNGND